MYAQDRPKAQAASFNAYPGCHPCVDFYLAGMNAMHVELALGVATASRLCARAEAFCSLRRYLVMPGLMSCNSLVLHSGIWVISPGYLAHVLSRLRHVLRRSAHIKSDLACQPPIVYQRCHSLHVHTQHNRHVPSENAQAQCLGK